MRKYSESNDVSENITVYWVFHLNIKVDTTFLKKRQRRRSKNIQDQ